MFLLVFLYFINYMVVMLSKMIILTPFLCTCWRLLWTALDLSQTRCSNSYSLSVTFRNMIKLKVRYVIRLIEFATILHDRDTLSWIKYYVCICVLCPQRKWTSGSQFTIGF